MIITQKTIVSFVMPDEYQEQVKFKTEHPDWKEYISTVMCSYEYVQTFTAKENKDALHGM